MDDRIKDFLDALDRNLDGLAEAERREALDYYGEYISDALDEGVSTEELLSRLDPPEKIAAMIRAETGIRLVNASPGLKNYSKLVKSAHIGLTRPLSVLMFSLLIFTTYSIAVILFLCTVISAAAACIILPASISEALKIPSSYPGGIAGTVGMGIFVSGIFVLTAYGFYVLCRPLFRVSARLVYKMLKKDSKPIGAAAGPNQDIPPSVGGRKVSRPLRAVLIITAAGLIISLASGLPVKLFMIFNSMKPFDIMAVNREFDTSEASEISIYTAHSNIRLAEGGPGKITLEYEKADWLDFDIENRDGIIVFTEKSNGRLPLFSLVSMHENRAELVIKLPPGYKPDRVSLESRGGSILIESASFPVDAKTYTGFIRLAVLTEGTAGGIPPSVRAKTVKGAIISRGKDTGTKTPYGTEYELLTASPASIRLESERGSIILE